MRLIFEKGKQRDLIEKYKATHKKCSWREIAKSFGINLNALKEWRYERASLPSKMYSHFDKKQTYIEWIIERRKDTWGQALGGRSSPGRHNRIETPQPSPKLAEFYGIMLGDGNVYINKKHGVYQIRVACHPIQEREYAMFVSGLFGFLFRLKTSLIRRGRGLYVCADSRELAYFLLKNLPGLKTRFFFPPWMLEDDKCCKAFVRGLIDTDGSVYRLSNKNPGTVRIGFKNADGSLSIAYRKALLKMGLHPSKLIQRNIFLTRKEDVRYYLKAIGFHNKKHRERLLKIATSSSGQTSM